MNGHVVSELFAVLCLTEALHDFVALFKVQS